jgi:hypothetical protein
LYADSCSGGCIFCGVVQQVEEDLFKEHGIDANHGEVLGKIDLDTVPYQNFTCPFQRAADDFAKVVERGIRHDCTRFQPGHVEQVRDESVEAFGFVDDRGDEVGLGLLVEDI